MSTGGTSWDTATPITLPYTSDPAPASDYPAGSAQPWNAAWWSLTVDADAWVSVDSFASTGDPDTYLYVYGGASESSKARVSSNDDSHGPQSSIRFGARAGVQYHIQLGMYGSGDASGVAYVLTASAAPFPEHLTPFTPPPSVTVPTAIEPLYDPAVSPSGGYVAGIMAGTRLVGAAPTPEQYPYSPYERNGISIGKRDGDNLTELFHKEFWDSNSFTVPRATFPESVMGYYQVGSPYWLSDNLLIQGISVSQYSQTGGGTIPAVSNFVLYQVSGTTVTEGIPFEIPGYQGAVLSPFALIGGRVYVISTVRGGGYSNPYHLHSFAVNGTIASDFASPILLGDFYLVDAVGWWSESVLLWTTQVVTGSDGRQAVMGQLSIVGLYDNSEVGSLDLGNVGTPAPRILTGGSEGSRVAWLIGYTPSGPTQAVTAQRVDVETMTMTGDPVPFGEPMADASGDVTSADDLYVHRVNAQRAVVYWSAPEDPATNYWDKTRAVWLDTSDLTVLHDCYVMDPVLYDPDHTDYMGVEPPHFGPDWGIVLIRSSSGDPWSYYWIDPVTLTPVPTEVAALLTAELLDSGARYE
jgi:hypothetical protein